MAHGNYKIRFQPNTSIRPPQAVFDGTCGPPLLIIAKNGLRSAERVSQSVLVNTADGDVIAGPGDFVVAMPTGERYPISADIYFGTYEVLNQVGESYIGRRLLHPRLAWPIISDGAELSYGKKRGTVAVTKGAWIYQSNDEDYGAINRKAKNVSYTVVGSAEELSNRNWRKKLSKATRLITALPAILIALSLFALYSWNRSWSELAEFSLVIEVILLAAGATITWWIRNNKWALRAAVFECFEDAACFQVVAEALGLKPSTKFPSMVLWRAGQEGDATISLQANQTQLKSIKSVIDHFSERINKQIVHLKREEALIDWLSWIVVFAVMLCLVTASMFHWLIPKLIAIWLPSAIGTAHAWTWQRQSLHRLGAYSELLQELRFVRSKLVALAPDNQVSESNKKELATYLRMLCLCVARHGQREIQFTTTPQPIPPG